MNPVRGARPRNLEGAGRGLDRGNVSGPFPVGNQRLVEGPTVAEFGSGGIAANEVASQPDQLLCDRVEAALRAVRAGNQACTSVVIPVAQHHGIRCQAKTAPARLRGASREPGPKVIHPARNTDNAGDSTGAISKKASRRSSPAISDRRSRARGGSWTRRPARCSIGGRRTWSSFFSRYDRRTG